MAKVEGRDNFGEDPKFFVGIEVERSPLYGKKTLFVIDKQTQRDFTEMFR